MKICFFCAEEIKDTALKCRFCGEWLTTSGIRPTFQELKQKFIFKNHKKQSSAIDFNIESDENFFQVKEGISNNWIVYRLAGQDYYVRKNSLLSKADKVKEPKMSVQENSHQRETSEISFEDDVLDVIRLFFAGMEKKLSKENEILCLRGGATLTFSEDPSVSHLFNDLLKGFFYMASAGDVFLPEESLKEKFGYSLRLKYPEANKVFLDFAKTYWSLEIFLEKCLLKDFDKFGAQLLLKTQKKIESIFFPIAGSSKISWQEREKEQRRFIKMSGAPIPLDAFMAGNAILIREKSAQKSVFSRIFNI